MESNVETLPGADSAGAPRSRAASYEANSGRRHIRIKMPIDVVIDGETYRAADWSLGGIRVADIATDRAPGDTFTAELAVPFPGFRFAVRVRCEVVSNDRERRRIGCKFIDLAEDQVEILRYLVDAYISGRVATVDAILHVAGGAANVGRRGSADHLAVPLGQRLAQAGRKTLQIGVLLALGGVLLALVGGALHARLFTVEATVAAVSAPTIDMRAPASGSLLGPGLLPGTRVAAGTELFEVRDATLEGNLEVARATLRREQAELSGLRRKLAERQAFFIEYRVLAAVDLEKAEAERERAAETYEIVQRIARRAGARRDRSAAATRYAEEALIKEIKAEHDLRVAVAALTEARSNGRMAEENYYYTGTRVEGGEPSEIERAIELAERSVATAEAKVSALVLQRRAMVARSPCDCVVHARLATPGEWLETGHLVYVLRSADESQTLIEVLVSQERADEVEIGATADVKLADRGSFLTARVVSVNRGRQYERRTGLPEASRRSAEFAAVLIAPDAPLAGVEIGLPAKVRLSSSRGSVLLNFFDRALAGPALE